MFKEIGMNEEYLKIIIKLYREEIAELREVESQYKQTKVINSIIKSHNRKLERRLIKQQQEILKLKLELSSYQNI